MGEVRRQAPGWASFRRCYVTWRPHLLYVNGRSRSGWGGLKGSGQQLMCPLSPPPPPAHKTTRLTKKRLRGKSQFSVCTRQSPGVSPYFQLSSAAAAPLLLSCINMFTTRHFFSSLRLLPLRGGGGSKNPPGKDEQVSDSFSGGR